MSNVLPYVAAFDGPVLIGLIAGIRWASSTTRKLDRLSAIFMPDDDPARRIDRRVEAVEAQISAHIAWHAGGGAPPLPTVHG